MKWDSVWKGPIEADKAYPGPLSDIDQTQAKEIQQKELLDTFVQNNQSLYHYKIVSCYMLADYHWVALLPMPVILYLPAACHYLVFVF
jgi:hypothetical protein